MSEEIVEAMSKQRAGGWVGGGVSSDVVAIKFRTKQNFSEKAMPLHVPRLSSHVNHRRLSKSDASTYVSLSPFYNLNSS